MPSNLAIDDRLLAEALKLGGEKTKKATVNRALQEFVSRRRQKNLRNLYGKLVWDESFDYKKERSRS